MHTSSPVPHSPTFRVSEAARLCVVELTRWLAARDLALGDLCQLRLFLPHYSSSPPLSAQGFATNMQCLCSRDVLSSELLGLTGAAAVTVTICEGYFGQNCPLSLQALLLPP